MVNVTEHTVVQDKSDGGVYGYGWLRIISGVTLLLILLVSLIMNSMILYVLRTKKCSCKKGNRFVYFLMLIELCVRLFGSPLIVLSVFAGRWLFGDFGCVYYAFMMTWLGITTISTLTVIAVERFLVIIPTHRQFISKRAAILAMSGCVIHGLVWAISPYFGWTEYVYEPSGLSCTPSWAPQHRTFVISLLMISFVIPLTSMSISYGCILMKVKTKTMLQRRSQVSDVQLAKTMMMIMGSFLFAWTPYAIIAGCGTFGVYMTFLPAEVTLIPLTCAKTSGLWNVVIYGIRNVSLRRLLHELIFKRNLTIVIQTRQSRTSGKDAVLKNDVSALTHFRTCQNSVLSPLDKRSEIDVQPNTDNLRCNQIHVASVNHHSAMNSSELELDGQIAKSANDTERRVNTHIQYRSGYVSVEATSV